MFGSSIQRRKKNPREEAETLEADALSFLLLEEERFRGDPLAQPQPSSRISIRA